MRVVAYAVWLVTGTESAMPRAMPHATYMLTLACTHMHNVAPCTKHICFLPSMSAQCLMCVYLAVRMCATYMGTRHVRLWLAW